MKRTPMKRTRKPRNSERGPWRSPAYLAWIRSLGCIFDGRLAEAAHVRYGDPEQGKPHTPMARKPGDNYALPLCAECHRTGPDAQHKSNERAWWAGRGINPIERCNALHAAWTAGDYEHGLAILRGPVAAE